MNPMCPKLGPWGTFLSIWRACLSRMMLSPPVTVILITLTQWHCVTRQKQSKQSSEETRTSPATSPDGLTHVLPAPGEIGWLLVTLPQAKSGTQSLTILGRKWKLVP